MLRTLITPTDTNVSILIPEEYVGKTIEVTLLAVEERESELGKKTMSEFWGVLSNETAEILHQQVDQSRKEW